jgi:pyrroline-5-carboxylate reductase
VNAVSLGKTIGFVGAGNMAEALIRGLIQGDVVRPDARRSRASSRRCSHPTPS